ncbi:SusC/RagA family TonB-linked outer membrane protein, partial [Saccharicrinis fermentans]
MKQMRTKSRKLLLMVAFLIASMGALFAQEKGITGVVTEKATGDPVPGVSVVVKGTTNGTITDMDGNYHLNVQTGEVVVFSFIGFTPVEITVGQETKVNVALEADVVSLKEVIAVGYGTSKKIELTGAVSSIKNESMERVIASDFTKALQGQIAGVRVTEMSGRPGDQATINIRGIGSINASTNQSPLYVVDGIPFENNPNIPSEEIESISVLKDGASAAIYGTRASNGVIVITTKKGKAGAVRVSYSGYGGIQNIVSSTPLNDTEQQIYVEQQKSLQGGGSSLTPQANPYMSDKNTDFVDYIEENNSAIQSHNLSLSSGSENLKFSLNVNYYDQAGVVQKSGYNRFSTRANTSYSKGKFDAFVSFGVQKRVQEVEPYAIYEYSIFQSPWRSLPNELPTTSDAIYIDGEAALIEQYGYFAKQMSLEREIANDSYNTSGNFKFEIIDGLTIAENVGFYVNNQDDDRWTPKLLLYSQGATEPGTTSQLFSQRRIVSTDYEKWTTETVLNYDKKFGEHSIKLTAVYSMEKSNQEYTDITKQDGIDNSLRDFNVMTSMVGINGYSRENTLTGKMFRAQYNYKNKYLFSGSVRYDGSSKFKEGSKYGTFPGASLGWNISEEPFMSGLTNVDNLKLRISYAEVGNEGILPYQYSPYVDANIDYVYGAESDDQLGYGAIQRMYVDENIGWETNISRNIGVDLSMFRSKLTMTLDLYKNSKEDMLFNQSIPSSSGTSPTTNGSTYTQFNSVVRNLGNMVNKGVELSMTYKHRTKMGLNLTTTGTFAMNDNEVTSLGGEDKVIIADAIPANWRRVQQSAVKYMVVGKPAGAFYLIPTDGIIKTQEELAEVQSYMPSAALGDVKYLDTNEDGTINDDDRVYSGSAEPKWEA